MKYENESKQVVKGSWSVCELHCSLLSIYWGAQQQAFPKILTVLPNHEDPTGSRETVSKEDLKGCEDLQRLQALVPGGILRVGGLSGNSAS